MGASPFLGLPDERPQVGDVLLHSSGYERTKPGKVTVTRIGRQYGYFVRYGREVAFLLDTGRMKGSSRGSVFTPEAQEARDHVSSLWSEIERYGFAFDWMGSPRRDDYPVKTLETLVAVLRESPVTPKKKD